MWSKASSLCHFRSPLPQQALVLGRGVSIKQKFESLDPWFDIDTMSSCPRPKNLSACLRVMGKRLSESVCS